MTPAAQREHVDRVLQRASDLGVRPISPTLPLTNASGPNADAAVEMARRAVAGNAETFVAIAGTASFWTSSGMLDAFVGEVVQLRPAGWAVTVIRDALRYPWPAVDSAEVQGVCRTVHSLSLRGAPVIMCHGDLAALPAVAAGASHVGTGWDLKQRLCSDDAFRQTGGGRSTQRVTHRGLLAVLKRPEAESLLAADPTLSQRLVPGPLPPDHNSHWRHHVRVVTERVDRVIDAGERQQRVNRLRRLYRQAQGSFDQVVRAAGRLEAGRAQWIDPLAAGLELYAESEGW